MRASGDIQSLNDNSIAWFEANVLLPVLAGCTLGLSLVMKLVSPGPVFFCQERVGLQGRRFKIYKFRTMKVGADSTQHLVSCQTSS